MGHMDIDAVLTTGWSTQECLLHPPRFPMLSVIVMETTNHLLSISWLMFIFGYSERRLLSLGEYKN